jgi:hypothetical protein
VSFSNVVFIDLKNSNSYFRNSDLYKQINLVVLIQPLSMLKEQIKTIKDFNQFTLKERSSEFIAKVYPIKSEEQALDEIQNIRKKYFDATHHCFAYRINDDLSKFSDDGEPKGTAGVRI